MYHVLSARCDGGVDWSYEGNGKACDPMIVSILGSCVLRILWIILVCNVLLPGQIECLYPAYPITWIVTCTVHTVCIVKAYRELIRRRDARAALFAEAEAQNLVGRRGSVNAQ